MRINEVKQPLQEVRTPSDAAPRSASSVEPKTFQRALRDMGREQYETHIKDLANAVLAQGEKLSQKADLKEFQRYREAVAELVKETVSGAYSFFKSGSFDARGRHRVFAVIRKINGDLEDIASEILSDQANNLRILDKIDDIRGLIVDMFL